MSAHAHRSAGPAPDYRDTAKSRAPVFVAVARGGPFKLARSKAHPDAGGKVDDFQRLEKAREALDKYFEQLAQRQVS